MKKNWRVDVETRRRFDALTGEPLERRYVWVSDDNKHVALMVEGSLFSSNDVLTNAALMAAAPKMFATLEAAERLLDDCSEKDPFKLFMRNLIKPAIQNARYKEMKQ